jgi:hypothetical protein
MVKIMIILNEEDTVNKLKEGFSLSRYGDGEFIRVILEARGISKLQSFNPDMRNKLMEVLINPIKNLMVGIPRTDHKKGWVKQFHNKFSKFISGKKIEKSIFASAFFSRPSMVNRNNEEYFKKVMSIWNDRKVVLINFNEDLVNHHLFKHCKIDFIQISRNDCFSSYNEISEQCKEFYNRRKIFLLSAGPTATCLVYDLACNGEHAIDIGQIALEYSLYKKEKDIIKWTSQNHYRNK